MILDELSIDARRLGARILSGFDVNIHGRMVLVAHGAGIRSNDT
jgi:hypothetical protein